MLSQVLRSISLITALDISVFISDHQAPNRFSLAATSAFFSLTNRWWHFMRGRLSDMRLSRQFFIYCQKKEYKFVTLEVEGDGADVDFPGLLLRFAGELFSLVA